MIITYLTHCLRALTISLACTLACSTGAAQQQRATAVSQYPAPQGIKSPLEVVSIRSKGETIQSGRQFQGSDDWLAGLTLSVKNVSDKPISFIDVRLLLPASEGSGHKNIWLPGVLKYGCWPGGRGHAPYALGSCEKIMPGRTQSIEITEETYKRMVDTFAELGICTPTAAAQFEIDAVAFDNDTLWEHGSLFKRDPIEPNTFRKVATYTPSASR
jgi:hypothetical protein